MHSKILQEARKTIFLADRSESFLIYLRILLERMGFRIVPLKKGAILQDLMQVMRPDLVMLGSFLEDMEGTSVLRSLRQNEAFAGVPAVMFCDSEHEDCSEDIRESDGVHYLSRPVNIFQLYKVVYDTIVFSSGEKRVHLRTSFREKVTLSYGDVETELWATSLSEGGIFVRSRKPLPGGEDVAVSVPLGFATPIRFQGKILYSRAAGPDGVSNVPGSAIQFVSVGPEQASQLRICIIGLLIGDLIEEQRDEPIFTVVSRTNDMYEDIVLDHIRIGQELKNSQLQMKSMVDTIPFGALIYRQEEDGHIAVVNVNPAARKRFGPYADSLEGLAELFSDRCHKNLFEIVGGLASKGGKYELRGAECRGSQPGIFDILAFQTGPRNAAVIFRDVSDRNKQEEDEIRLQKLEALGMLAGGIAHDFNNLLQGVFGYISMAKMTLDRKEQALEMLEQAEKALHMSVGLTTQLLSFSKGGDPPKKKIPLQPVIENSVKFALSGSRVDCRIEVAEGLRMVEADEGQLGQVIQNLVLNAKQAMPTGGTILIAVENVSSPREGLPRVLPQGNYVGISVKDSGIGIPEQYLPKIFDPYFTTKDKGSGLGLATSYSIIKNHGGWIDVKSKLGEGTTFFVYLPAVEGVETPAVTVSEDVPALRKSRILFMDDEEIVRHISGVMLRSLGYEVELVEDGKEAVDKYRQSMRSGRQFGVVIMDLTVRGGMGGKEAIKELLEIDPDVKTIVSSGYADSSALSEYEALGFKACLAKPYDIASLKSTLHSLLS